MYSKSYKFLSAVQVLFVLSGVTGCSSLSMRTMSMQSPDTGLSPLETLTASYLLSSAPPREKQALRNYKRGLYALRNAPEGLWFRGACPPVFQLVRQEKLEATIAYLNCYNQQKRHLRHRKGISLPAVCSLHGESLVTLALRYDKGPLRDQLVDRLIMYDLVYDIDTFAGVDSGIRLMIFSGILSREFSCCMWRRFGKAWQDVQYCDLEKLVHVLPEQERALEADLSSYGSLAAWRIETVNAALDELLVSKFSNRGIGRIVPHRRLLDSEAQASLRSMIANQSFCDRALSGLCSNVAAWPVRCPGNSIPFASSRVTCIKHVAPLREILRYGSCYTGDEPGGVSTASKRLRRVIKTHCFSCKKGLGGKGLCKCCGRSWCRTKACRRYHEKYAERLIQRIQKKPLHVCASCGRARGRFRCTGCNSGTWYCNRLCQKRHWQVHRAVCGAINDTSARQCSWPGCPSHRLSDQDCYKFLDYCFFAKCKRRKTAVWCWRERCSEYGWQAVRHHGVKYHKGLDSMSAVILQGFLCCALSLSIDCVVEKTTESFECELTEAQLLAAFDRLKDKLHPLPFTAEAFVAGLSMTYQQRQEALSKLARAIILPPWDASPPPSPPQRINVCHIL